MRGFVPKQIPWQAIEDIGTRTADVIFALLGGSYVLASVNAASYWNFIGLLDSLQLIFHLPIMNVPFPDNARIAFEMMIPVVNFDILEHLGLLQEWFGNER